MTAVASTRTWSLQQEAIFDHFINGQGHLVVRARAGTGKTTTIVEAVKRWMRANPGKTVIVCAFNTRIKDELVERFRGTLGVEVKTLHAIGFACCRRFRERLIIEDARKVEVTRKDALALAACGKQAPDAILKLVAKLHTLGRETVPHAKNLGDLTATAIAFECEPEEAWVKAGFDLEYVEAAALKAMELASDVKNGDTIDFADMIFLPVRNGWLVGLYDKVVVDEAQDMTTAQLEVAAGVMNEGGTMDVVGDDRQGIYGFRGGDSTALDRLKAELNAEERGLTTTYRCGRAIVDVARGWVPDFEAGPNNPEGFISYLDDKQEITKAAGPGDFILSRVNAPLVGIAMSLLRAGKRAEVAGKDIGDGLLSLLRKMKARSVPDLLAKIELWAAKEVSRTEAQMTGAKNGRREALKIKIENTRDKADMLAMLCDGARNVDEVTERAEALFTNKPGMPGVITCSSVHKAKGLEADRVFILADTLRETSIEEQNICYVAVTRAKRELTWVGSRREEGDGK